MRTALDELREHLIAEWDETDKKTKAQINADYEALIPAGHDWKAFEDGMQKIYHTYTKGQLELRYETDEQIHTANVKAADKMIDNLVQRVEKKIGTITDYTGVYTNPDNEGFMVINGWFKGEKGSCEVRSISAGGYNIQKRHIRVLVK